MRASDHIWALVCGYPNRVRRTKLMGIFQAYLDESIGEPPRGIFALCGFIATAEQWAAFSDEWQRHLDFRSGHYRKIDAFHLKDMQSEGDQERIRWFYKVIEDHVKAAVCFFLDLRALYKVYDEFDWGKEAADFGHPFRNPYYWAFVNMIALFPRIKKDIGVNTPIDLFLDETTNKYMCLMAWDTFKEQASPEALAQMGQTPAFRDDEKVLPLQAADLWVGTTREWAEEILASPNADARLNALRTAIPPDFPWPIKGKLPVWCDFRRENDLREQFRSFFEDYQKYVAELRRKDGEAKKKGSGSDGSPSLA